MRARSCSGSSKELVWCRSGALCGEVCREPFVSASAEALPFRTERFDAIWSVYVLEHVPYPEEALREIVRLLKPGYPVCPWSDFDWRGKLIKAPVPLGNSLWFRAAYSLPLRMCKEVLHQLTLEGLGVSTIDDSNRTIQFTGVRSRMRVVRWILTICPYGFRAEAGEHQATLPGGVGF